MLLCVVPTLLVVNTLIHGIMVLCADAIDCVVDVMVSDADVIASLGESITC